MMQITMQIDAYFELISWNIDVGGLGDAVIKKYINDENIDVD